MACTWVTPVALIGHAFASDVSTLRDYIEKTSWGITTGLFLNLAPLQIAHAGVGATHHIAHIAPTREPLMSASE